MPIQVKIKTYNFVDETGTMIPDAKYTVRTRISHDARNKYMGAISSQIPDLADAIDYDKGKLKEGFSPTISPAAVDTVTRILLEDGLIDLEGVLDINGKEIKTWHEFVHHDDFYVSQVVKILQENALATPAPSPNVSAPSVVH